MITSVQRKFKKSVTFIQRIQQAGPSLATGQSTQFSGLQSDTQSKFSRRKMFNIQNGKFMSLKHINSEQSSEHSYSFDPVTKLKQQIQKMEDILAKTQQSYNRKIVKIGKKFNKQCEKFIGLQQQAMELKNQLKKNLKMIAQIKLCIGKQNVQNQYQIHERRKSKDLRHHHFRSPFRFHRI